VLCGISAGGAALLLTHEGLLLLGSVELPRCFLALPCVRSWHGRL